MININVIALITSFLFVFLIITLGTILEKKKIVSKEGSRKVIHIIVANWWFIYMFMFNNILYALIPPITFIILNIFSYKYKIIDSMERDNSDSLGTIYYPISLLFLVIFSYLIKDKIISGIGILILGYGDGLAALVGKKYNKIKLLNNKTLFGTLTMFIISTIISTIFLIVFKDLKTITLILVVFITAVSATILELFTKKGLDNLTIPIGVTIILYLLLNVII